MSVELQGGSNGEGLRIAVVVATFNDFITSKLLEGALAALDRHGVRDGDITVARVPGSFELPLAAKKLSESARHDAVICLGAVIRGETDHYEHVAGEAAKGIANASINSGLPVIFGVLTTDTLEAGNQPRRRQARQQRLQRRPSRHRDGEPDARTRYAVGMRRQAQPRPA